MSYHDIAIKYGTDKATHGYMQYYEKHFGHVTGWNDRPIKSILEIGFEKGNSIRMWRELFPEATLFSLDLFEEWKVPPDLLPDMNFHIYKGNQTDGELLDSIRSMDIKRLDVIIDDGSHNSRDQLMTFYGLAGKSLLYVVEDLHCCYEEFYRQGLALENTMLGQMKTGNFPFQHTLYDNKIAFIYV